MKKSLIKLASFAFAIAIASSSFAAEGKPSAGKVSAVADGSITVANKKSGDQIFKTGADTKVLKADGSAGSLSDIKSGVKVKVTAGSAPDQAAQIQIVEAKKKDDGDKAAKSKKADE